MATVNQESSLTTELLNIFYLTQKMNNEYICIYSPDQLTDTTQSLGAAGAASATKISRFDIPGIFLTLNWI